MKYYIKYTIIFILVTSEVYSANRIMPLGDSITYGITSEGEGNSGYRNYLWYSLQGAKMDVDFVGSVTGGISVTPSFDTDNEGHPGWDQFEIAEKTTSYLRRSQPNTILLHVGTNDRGTTNPDGINQILNLVDMYELENNATVDIHVALIIDRKEHDGRIEIFNRRLADLLQQRISNGDNISIVDMYNNAGLTDANYGDPTHPNNSGYQKIANTWFQALSKPFNPTLSAFPYSIVDIAYIKYTTTNATSTFIDIVTEVPNDGITF